MSGRLQILNETEKRKLRENADIPKGFMYSKLMLLEQFPKKGDKRIKLKEEKLADNLLEDGYLAIGDTLSCISGYVMKLTPKGRKFIDRVEEKMEELIHA